MHRSMLLRCCAAFVPSVKVLVNPATKAAVELTCASAPSDRTLFPLSNILKINSQRRYLLQSYHSSSKPLFSKPFMNGQNDGINENEKGSDNNTDDINRNQYKKFYHITGMGTKSFVSMKTDTNHTIKTDVPKKMGGGDEAPQPVEILLASWMGCTQATALYVGRNMEPRLLIDKIEFDVEAYRDERGALGGELPICAGSALPDIPARLEKVTGTVKVYLRENRNGVTMLNEEQLSLLGEQTERRCPVANMMAMSGIEMNIQWKNG